MAEKLGIVRNIDFGLFGDFVDLQMEVTIETLAGEFFTYIPITEAASLLEESNVFKTSKMNGKGCVIVDEDESGYAAFKLVRFLK